MTDAEREFFFEHGYLHARAALGDSMLTVIREEFEQIWATDGRANQLVLLKHRTFIDLIEHPPILDRHAAIFGRQTQLLQYDFLRQEPGSTFPLRSWHRDLSFPGEKPVSINTIVYLDRMDDASGPTYVVPGSHLAQSCRQQTPETNPIPMKYPSTQSRAMLYSSTAPSGTRGVATSLTACAAASICTTATGG